MALSSGDLIQVLSFYTTGQIEALMVSYWRVENLEGVLVDADWAEVIQYGIQHIARVRDVMSSTAKAYRTVFNNLSKPMEYGEFIGDDFGTQSGQAAPSFEAVSVKQQVPTRLTRAGYKRIPFVSDSLSNGNALTLNTTTKTALETFFGSPTEFETTVDGEIGNMTLQPLVIGRTKNAEGVYELDLDKIQEVSSAAVQSIVSHQVSRDN
jgi:hypothetical protein